MTETQSAVAKIFREALDIEVDGADVDVIEVGLLDSLGLVALIAEIEERHGVEIPFETLEVDHFRTVRSIAALLEEREMEPDR